MAQTGLPIRKILEILRLHFDHGASGRAVARAVCVALATVQDCLRRLAASGLSWPVDLDGEALVVRLYPPVAKRCSPPLPDFVATPTSSAVPAAG